MLLVSLLLFAGCAHKQETTNNNSPIENKVATTTAEMPSQMPSDFNFKVSFGYGDVNKNIVDTYSRTVTKDLIAKGTITTDFTFSTTEMQDIYSRMKEIDIMGTKQLTTAEGCFQTPSNEDSWQITVDGEESTLTWTDQACGTTADAKQLLELRQYIQHIVAGKEAYQALPESEGGYD